MTETKQPKLSEETLQSLEKLGGILMKIAHRLVSEGKASIVDGKIIFNEYANNRTNKKNTR